MTPTSPPRARPPIVPYRRPRLGRAAAIATALLACSHAGEFIWVEQVPRRIAAGDEVDAEYRVAPGDVIGIRVWNQDAISVERARVREDGKISMPFLNDVEVVGMTPADLARRLEVKLKSYIVNPVVTVVVQERIPLKVSVVGEVARPGVYALEGGAGVLHALAAAGGVTQYAHRDRIYVLRSGYWADGNPSPARIRFRYDELRRGAVPATIFRLRPGDVVVVE